MVPLVRLSYNGIPNQGPPSPLLRRADAAAYTARSNRVALDGQRRLVSGGAPDGDRTHLIHLDRMTLSPESYGRELYTNFGQLLLPLTRLHAGFSLLSLKHPTG